MSTALIYLRATKSLASYRNYQQKTHTLFIANKENKALTKSLFCQLYYLEVPLFIVHATLQVTGTLASLEIALVRKPFFSL